ncbi:MAG: ABC transporter substrate-binding protein [Deltaproteobacteria bacterium]|nr:ABC transporter substrate-binding protein [Deltaproteobacteria bacterium]
MRTPLIVIILLGAVVGLCPINQAPCADEPTPIVFLTWKPNQPEGWNRLIQRFQREHPEIRIKLQIGPHSSTEYHAIVTQRLRNRDPSVDVFLMDVIWPPEFANAGWALDLTSRFPLEEQKRFLVGPIHANTYQGRIYGVPCYLGAGLFYYRKDLLKKYNLTPPQTWEEMITKGEIILKGEGDPRLVVYSAQFKQYEGLVCDMMEFIWSNGGGTIDRTTGQVLLDKPAAIQAVSFVRDRIIGKAAPRGVLNYEEPESLDLFTQGKAVFHRNWPYAWSVADDPKKSRVAGRIGVGRLPHFPGHDSASTLGGWQFGINRYSRHPEAAWQFIQFMTSAQGQKILALASGLAPTRRSVYEDPLIQEKTPYLKAFLPAFEKARTRPPSPVYPMISQELQRFFSRAISEKGSDLSGMARVTSARIKRLLRLGDMTVK